jgi:general secretion pathway protein D
VLGGLIEKQVGESVQKVPLLGDIPLLGVLFKSKTADVTRTNLMVFIHPVILRDSGVTANYTNSKYNYLRDLQRKADDDGVNLLPGESHPVMPEVEKLTAPPQADAPAAVEPPQESKKTHHFFFTDE